MPKALHNGNQAARLNGATQATPEVTKQEGIKKRWRSIPGELRQAIVETLQETHNTSLTARLHGVAQSLVWRIANAEGSEVDKRGHPIPAELRQAIAETLEATHNAHHAARQHDVDPKTACRIAKAKGIGLGN